MSDKDEKGEMSQMHEAIMGLTDPDRQISRMARNLEENKDGTFSVRLTHVWPRCPWTGQQFEPVTRGGHKKVFANSTARAEAHKAARNYTEHLIESGFLTWEGLREWYRSRTKESASYTTREGRDDGFAE